MTPLNVAMMIIIPISLMGVIGLVLLSGSIPAARRRAFERGMIWLFYPAMLVFWLGRGLFALIERDWLWAFASIALGVVMAFQGVRLVRKPMHRDGTRT